MNQLQETKGVREVAQGIESELAQVGAMLFGLWVAKIVDCKRSGIYSCERWKSILIMIIVAD